MSRVGFEPTTPVFERAKTVYALDREVTVIGKSSNQLVNKLFRKLRSHSVSPSAKFYTTVRSGSAPFNVTQKGGGGHSN
jgi:hypothetical protein